MRKKLIIFLKSHPKFLAFAWKCMRIIIGTIGVFIPIKPKTMIFASFGGRSFDDSPKAIYDEICKRKEFKNWKLIWAFDDPDKFEVPRGRKIKIDTPSFFYTLLSSKVWISNSGMSRGIKINKNNIIKVETWHGTPLKKIGGEENQTSIITRKKTRKINMDNTIIRCAQSEYDKEIFKRIFHCSDKSFLMCGLPRNDALFHYKEDECNNIRKKLEIPCEKKILLYTPTYREYLVNESHETYMSLPINLEKWREKLADEYVLLIRAHYAVIKEMGIKSDDFIKDVSSYPTLNDLYIIADAMISDYSSTYIDYSILNRPMFCFAYDLEEYSEKRGLYIDLEKELPCRIDKTEDELLDSICNMNEKDAIQKTISFHNKYVPNEGMSSKVVVDKIIHRMKNKINSIN